MFRTTPTRSLRGACLAPPPDSHESSRLDYHETGSVGLDPDIGGVHPSTSTTDSSVGSIMSFGLFRFRRMEQRVSLITLGVGDLERSRTFYRNLGWVEASAPADDVVFFQAGGMVLALWSRENLAEDSAVSDSGGWGGVTLAYNTRSTGEVDDVIEEARAAGGTVGREPGVTFWGGYSGIFIDPDGHPWEVAHNPGWTIEADGSVTIPTG
jgi:predicted lactoylglutathione lyase